MTPGLLLNFAVEGLLESKERDLCLSPTQISLRFSSTQQILVIAGASVVWCYVSYLPGMVGGVEEGKWAESVVDQMKYWAEEKKVAL